MMIRKATIGALAVAALAVAACAGPTQDEFTAKDTASIRQRSDTLATAFNAKDVPKILELYADNSVFMPPNQPILRGGPALKTFFGDLIAQGANGLKLTVDEVSGHGPLGYASGTYEMEYKPASGSATRDRGKFLFVLRKMVGNWRYEYMIWNSDLPASDH